MSPLELPFPCSKATPAKRARRLWEQRALFIRPKIPDIPGGESEWNKYFPEFHSRTSGVPREGALKFRKIGITGNSVSIFISAPVSPSLEIEFNIAAILKLLNIISMLYLTNDNSTSLQWTGLNKLLVNSAKVHVSYVKCGHDRAREQLARLETDSLNSSGK